MIEYLETTSLPIYDIPSKIGKPSPSKKFTACLSRYPKFPLMAKTQQKTTRNISQRIRMTYNDDNQTYTSSLNLESSIRIEEALPICDQSNEEAQKTNYIENKHKCLKFLHYQKNGIRTLPYGLSYTVDIPSNSKMLKTSKSIAYIVYLHTKQNIARTRRKTATA